MGEGEYGVECGIYVGVDGCFDFGFGLEEVVGVLYLFEVVDDDVVEVCYYIGNDLYVLSG